MYINSPYIFDHNYELVTTKPYLFSNVFVLFCGVTIHCPYDVYVKKTKFSAVFTCSNYDK